MTAPIGRRPYGPDDSDTAPVEEVSTRAALLGPREIVETVVRAWHPVSDPRSPSLCGCGHLHYLRRVDQMTPLSWRFCEDRNCPCQCLRRSEAGEQRD